MNILIDAHMVGSHEGGNERYTKNLVASLSQIAQVNVVTVKNNFLRLFMIPFLAIFKKIDVVHTNYTLPIWKPIGCKYVVTIHDLSFRRYPHLFSLRERLIFSLLVPYALWLSDAIIVPSMFTKHELIHFFPQYKQKTHVTYEGVDPAFYPMKSVKSKRKFYLCVASKSKRKNIDFIINNFKSANLKNTYLYIVGGHIIGQRSQSNIKYLGYVDDKKLNSLYNSAMALIYLSTYEGFGLPIIEALACNTTVIASDTPAHREIAKQYARYIQLDNGDSFKKALHLSKPLKRTLSAHILKLYNWGNTAVQTLNIYKSLI